MPDITRDAAGNIRLVQNKSAGNGIVGSVAYPAASLKMTSASAATATATLTGVTGKQWLVEEASIILCSVASAAAVSLFDGTTTYSLTLSAGAGLNVQYSLPVNWLAASGASVGLGVGTAGTASSSTAILKGRLVIAADV